jgi:hypothetical protein
MILKSTRLRLAARVVELYKRALVLDPNSVAALSGAVIAPTNESFSATSYDIGMHAAPLRYRAKAS